VLAGHRAAALEEEIGQQVLQARILQAIHPVVRGDDAKAALQVYGQGPAVLHGPACFLRCHQFRNEVPGFRKGGVECTVDYDCPPERWVVKGSAAMLRRARRQSLMEISRLKFSADSE
jgi:hypothetical protein